jgi:hypothetical protein
MDTMITDILDPDLSVDDSVETVYRRALKDDPDAILLLADYYWQGRMVRHDYDKAIALYRHVAMKGSVEAARTLGYIYGYGPNDIEIDFDESAKWYLMAARKGDAESQFEYGYYLYKGLGPDRSFPEAFDWLSLSAEQGNPQAMFYLGEMFRNGYGVDFSLRSAVRMYRAAALKDEPLA